MADMLSIRRRCLVEDHMRYLYLSLGLLAVMSMAVVIVGFLLPPARQGTSERMLPATPARVAETLLEVESQPGWRGGIAEVDITPDWWIERTDRGETISFRIAQRSDQLIELTFESSRGYHGSWKGELLGQDEGTLLRVTETAVTPSPFGRILSRLFFDPEIYARQYLDALAAEVARREAAS
jgi:hypothetical protein